MNGLLIIDKPAGLTSHDVVARVRRILQTRRVGHTGTLDPFATGVLVLLIGKATRLAQFVDKDEKEYEAVVQFGFETDTGDRTGMPIAGEGGLLPDDVDWESVLSGFRGRIQQVPPMYSAKKIDGKKLYELARSGVEVERKAALVEILRLEIDRPAAGEQAAQLRIECSAGTYIRTLAEDIGRRAGCAAHLRELRRTRAGKFTIAKSITLETLRSLDDPSAALIPMTEAVSRLRTIPLTPDRVKKTLSGLATRFAGDAAAGEAMQMTGPGGELIAVGIYDAAEQAVRPKVVLV